MSGGPPWEVGGAFAWEGLPGGPFLRWPKRASLFSLARHAVSALAAARSGGRVWAPSYFCHEVADYWRGRHQVFEYEDDPRWAEPRWSTLTSGPGDLVIAVNYFGYRNSRPWWQWRREHECVLVEDHSHDPACWFALHSQADYVVSSLRKTMPVPDGAILWSPRKLALPPAAPPVTCPGIWQIMAGMLLKQQYLAGDAEKKVKRTYRKLWCQGEEIADQSLPAAPSVFSELVIRSGIPRSWRLQREQNVRVLVRQLRDWKGAKLLFNSWPEGSVPLGVILVFDSQKQRDRARRQLERANVYCPIHWAANAGSSRRVCDLAARMLTIPADQRYNQHDMQRVATLCRQTR